jgi:hypothetical protein
LSSLNNDAGTIMTNANRIVVSGATLILSPELAKHFGNSEALILQQVHYWLSQQNMRYGLVENGVQWIRNSYKQWQAQIPHRSISTIRRAFAVLEMQNIIQSKTVKGGPRYNGGEQVKYFTINYDALEKAVGNLSDLKIYRPGCNVITEYRAGNIDQSTQIYQQTMFKMNTPPVQNEHPYISKTTSKIKSSFSKCSQPANRAGNANTVPQEEKINLKNLSSEMLRHWNTLIEDKENPVTLTPKLSCYLNKSLKQFFSSDLKNWESFCHKIASSKFLMGEVTPFKAQLDWVLKFEVTQKILDGGYTFGDRGAGQGGNSWTRSSNTSSHRSYGQPSTPDKILSIEDPEGISEAERTLREQIRSYLGDQLYSAWFRDARIHMPEGRTANDVQQSSYTSSETSKRESKPVLVIKSRFVQDRFLHHWDLCKMTEIFFEDVVLEGSPLLSVRAEDTKPVLVDTPIEPDIEESSVCATELLVNADTIDASGAYLSDPYSEAAVLPDTLLHIECDQLRAVALVSEHRASVEQCPHITHAHEKEDGDNVPYAPPLIVRNVKMMPAGQGMRQSTRLDGEAVESYICDDMQSNNKTSHSPLDPVRISLLHLKPQDPHNKMPKLSCDICIDIMRIPIRVREPLPCVRFNTLKTVRIQCAPTDQSAVPASSAVLRRQPQAKTPHALYWALAG